jgi:hypothetical protein
MEILLQTLGSSVGGAIILGFLGYLFRSWISERLKHSIKHEYAVKLEELSRKLELEVEKARLQFSRYSEHQFTIYNELWSSLCDLKLAADDLWDAATYERLSKLSEQLAHAYDKLEKSALLIEPEHYGHIKILLDAFAEFKFGKRNLLEIRQLAANQSGVTETNISEVIDFNKGVRAKLLKALPKISDSLRRQIRGEDDEHSQPIRPVTRNPGSG